MSEPTRPWALVLGASGGTGGAVARCLARDPGWNVFGVHRGNHPEPAAAVEAAVEAAGRRCFMRLADAGTSESADAGAAQLEEIAGPRSVGVLAHAIASASYGRFASGARDQLHPRQIRKTFETMAHSFIYWVQALRERDLLAPGARIVAFTNPFADSCANGWGLIAAAKAALELYVRQLGLELGGEGYRTALVKFGLVETRAIRIAFGDAGWQNVTEAVAGVTPAGRLSTTEEVAELVSFLVDPRADWFNGATIDFTGGQAQSLINPLFNPGIRADGSRGGGDAKQEEKG